MPPEEQAGDGESHRQKRIPFALVQSTKRGQRLSAIDDMAQELGLMTGMALVDALALCPQLQTSPARPRNDAHRLLQLAGWCERYSPLCNIYGDNSLWIDVTGVAHLFGSEERLLETIHADFQKLGHRVVAGLASSFGAAFASAHFITGNDLQARILPFPNSGRTICRALFPLPVNALRLDSKTIALLQRLGFLTIGQLNDLPRDSLKRRFSSSEQAKAVLLRLDQLFGRRAEPLSPLIPPVAFSCRLRFADALSSQKMLKRALVRLIDDITNQLEKQNQGARQLAFSLWRADGSTAHIKVGTSNPCRDKNHIFNLFQEKLNHMEPGFGIDVLALVVNQTEHLSARQTSLASPASVDHTASPALLLDRLRNRLGPEKIGYLHPLASHIPEHAQKISPKPASQSHTLSDFPADRPFLLLKSPERIEVIAPLADAPPLSFIWRRLQRKVVASSGPERLAPQWWQELDQKNSRTRDYYKVKTEKGTSFWLYRDGLYESDDKPQARPQWFMHGFFG